MKPIEIVNRLLKKHEGDLYGAFAELCNEHSRMYNNKVSKGFIRAIPRKPSDFDVKEEREPLDVSDPLTHDCPL